MAFHRLGTRHRRYAHTLSPSPIVKAARSTTATMPARVRVLNVVRRRASILTSTRGPTRRRATTDPAEKNDAVSYTHLTLPTKA